nr:hypothetical protein [Anaerohalosphaera lusitana]
MAAAAVRAGEVGDFVMVVPGGGERVDCEFVHAAVGLFVGRGEFARFEGAVERRAGFVGQAIGGNVLGGQREDGVERSLPVGERRAGQCEDQIERDVSIARVAGAADGGGDVVGGVRSAEQCEFAVAERLRADRQPVDAVVAKAGKQGRREMVRVGFDGEFTAVGRDAEVIVDRVDQAEQVGGRDAGRCAAANVDGGDRLGGVAAAEVGDHGSDELGGGVA